MRVSAKLCSQKSNIRRPAIVRIIYAASSTCELLIQSQLAALRYDGLCVNQVRPLHPSFTAATASPSFVSVWAHQMLHSVDLLSATHPTNWVAAEFRQPASEKDRQNYRNS